MTGTASSILSAWSNFYVMVGSSAAALTGLMFVVITLVSGSGRRVGNGNGIAAFSTPIVMHFTAVLLVSAVLIAPWGSLLRVGVVVALVGLCGLAYILRAAHRTWRLTAYRADFEDWVWFTILPVVAYGAIIASAIVLRAVPVQALFGLAGSVILLIVIGIRDAWDIVTYLAVQRP